MTQSHLYPHPANEPNGEGNGWDECSPDEATAWEVEDLHGMVEASFDSKAEAVAYIEARDA